MALQFMCLSKNLSMSETHHGMSCVKNFCTNVGLHRVSVVTLQDATKFALATHGAFGLRNEGFVQNSVVPSDTSVGSLLVIVFEPNSIDVVQLVKTETEEVSGAGESHPRALLEPDVHVSAHPAPIPRNTSRHYS